MRKRQDILEEPEEQHTCEGANQAPAPPVQVKMLNDRTLTPPTNVVLEKAR